MRSDRKYEDAAAAQWTWGLEPRHILVFWTARFACGKLKSPGTWYTSSYGVARTRAAFE